LHDQAPEGWVGTPKSTPARGSHVNRSSRIPNSPQIFMICRSVAIRLAQSGGPSKRCRHDLIVFTVLRLGFLPFLIFFSLFNSRAALCVHPLQNFASFFRMRTGTLWEFWPSSRMYLCARTELHSRQKRSTEPRLGWERVPNHG
jgi:hypothetical protein